MSELKECFKQIVKIFTIQVFNIEITPIDLEELLKLEDIEFLVELYLRKAIKKFGY